MGAKMRALRRYQVVVAGLFIGAVIISAVGCGTSSLGYRASWQDAGGPRLSMYNGKIEHNLFNGRDQKVEKEDWEDD